MWDRNCLSAIENCRLTLRNDMCKLTKGLVHVNNFFLFFFRQEKGTGWKRKKPEILQFQALSRF